MKLTSLIFGAVAVAMLPVIADAAVEYQFTAFDSDPIDPYTSISGSFTYIAPGFITSDTTAPLADLSSCSGSDSVLGPLNCLDQEFAIDVSPPNTTVLFQLENVTVYYYFDQTAFSTVGVHDSILLGDAQSAELTVSILSVPEASTWAMLAAGFGAMAAAMRLRRRSVWAPKTI
jgi:hypothetical protein